MAATDAMVAELRRYIAEPDQKTYTDDDLKARIETYPLQDRLGNLPDRLKTYTIPATFETNPYWSPTYDIHRAAAEIWQEKAAQYVSQFDFSTDGQSFQTSQVYNNMMGRYRFHMSKRAARWRQIFPEMIEKTQSHYRINEREGEIYPSEG